MVLSSEGLQILDLAEKQPFDPISEVFFEAALKEKLILIEKAYMQLHLEEFQNESGVKYLHNKLNQSLSGIRWYFVNSKLPEIVDEGVDAISLMVEGNKAQIALQIEDAVFVQKELFDKLDHKNQAALILHEIALNHVMKDSPESLKQFGTSRIRTFVNFVMNEASALNLKKIISTFRRTESSDVFDRFGKPIRFSISIFTKEEVDLKLNSSKSSWDALEDLYQPKLRGDRTEAFNEFEKDLNDFLRNKVYTSQLSADFLKAIRLMSENLNFFVKDSDLAYYQEQKKMLYNIAVVKNHTKGQAKSNPAEQKVVALVKSLERIVARVVLENEKEVKRTQYFTKVYLD